MSWVDVLKMPANMFNEFWEAITVIEAQTMLTGMTVADYPHIRKQDRTNVHRRIYEMAHPSLFENENIEPIKLKDIGQAIGKVYRG